MDKGDSFANAKFSDNEEEDNIMVLNHLEPKLSAV
jgi:hypothetical protein